MINEEYLTVSQLNKYVKGYLSKDSKLKKVYLKGEISNHKLYPSGHHYFTLKDNNSSISAVMYAGPAKFLKFNVENGMKVLVQGNVTLYSNRGQYQIQVKKMLEDGRGSLHIAFEQLKKKLNAEGLFNDEIKKSIPKFPKRIGVITASRGAAIRDIITTIERRWPYCEILLFSSLVQGKGASENIVRQIRHSEKYNLDTLIIGRGGGSIEDLWSFNEEIVARAIYNCSTPVISAVGHEIDVTISDFVADLRAPTPTAAAELAVPNFKEIKDNIENLNFRLNNVISDRLNSYQKRLDDIKESNIINNPDKIYSQSEIHLDMLKERLENSSNTIITKKELELDIIKESHIMKDPYSILSDKENSLDFFKEHYILKNPDKIIDKSEHKYLELIEKLELLNPLLTIKRGYTLAKKDGKIISKSEDLSKGDKLEIQFSDGDINTQVL